ncbi:MAG: DUF3168 domain-containing protein [Hyphomicrobiaceae bacterium]
MPLAPDWSLQKAVFAALSADATLTGLIGPDRIHDGAPQSETFPYLTFGQSLVRDWSTTSDTGAEHVLTIHVWSRAAGKKEALAIMRAVRSVLHDRPLALEDHHLVNLRHEFSDAARDGDGETMHGIVRFRAVTEAVA